MCFSLLFFKIKVRLRLALLVLVLSGISIWACAQVSVRGRVVDQERGLPAASVFLLAQDSTYVHGVVSDSVGGFVFNNVIAGDYLVSAHMIGHTRYYSTLIKIALKNIVIPEIMLKEEQVSLNEIVINEDGEAIALKSDRVVLDVENSVTSSGSTVLEVLQKSPGVLVNRQNNSIRINGRSGATVMINERPVPLSSDGLIQWLEGMSAANVEKIELITTPESKYDAEGSGGIIHIVTKDQSDLGTNASFTLTAGASWAETFGGNLGFNHRAKNFACFGDYALTRRHNLHLLETERIVQQPDFDSRVTGFSHRENVTLQQNFRGGFEWTLNHKTSLDLEITGYERNWGLDAETNEVNHVAGDSTIATDMRIAETNIWRSAAASIGLRHIVNTKHDLRFTVDYLYYANHNPSDYQINSFYKEGGQRENSLIDLKKYTPIRFLVSRADYHHRANASFSWDVGLKSVYSILHNDVSVQRKADEEWIEDATFSSSSALQEYIYAGYFSAKWQMRGNIEMTGGFRYEFTHTSITSPGQEALVDRKYGYFFPGFSLSKSLGEENDIKLSYTRRITRPGYNDIAPYVFFWGPHTFSAGNTKLYPAVADIINVGYHLKQWNVSLQLVRSRNEIAPLQPEEDGRSNLIYRSQNLKLLNTIGLTNSYSAVVRSWWDMQASIAVQYQAASATHLTVHREANLFGYNVALINRMKLPKDFSIEMSALYQSRTISGISMWLPIASLNAGIRKKFGKKGTLQLSMDDILYKTNWRIKTTSPDNSLRNYFRYDWHNQFIRLTYSRRLGNLKLSPAKHRAGAEEERGRIQ